MILIKKWRWKIKIFHFASASIFYKLLYKAFSSEKCCMNCLLRDVIFFNNFVFGVLKKLTTKVGMKGCKHCFTTSAQNEQIMSSFTFSCQPTKVVPQKKKWKSLSLTEERLIKVSRLIVKIFARILSVKLLLANKQHVAKKLIGWTKNNWQKVFDHGWKA